MSYQSVNPFNGKVLKTFKELTDLQLEKKIKLAAGCFVSWRHKTFAERAIIVTKAATILRARVDGFALPVTLEMGKLIAEARGGPAVRRHQNSGYGRELSSLGIQEFVNKKLVRTASIDAAA